MTGRNWVAEPVVARSRGIGRQPQAADGFEAFIQFVEGFVEQFPQFSFKLYVG